MNNKAEFYYRSYIDRDVSGFALSSTEFLEMTKITDRDKTSYSGTDGCNSDLVSVEIEIDLIYEREVGVIVLKSNLREFDIQRWDGSNWVSFSPAISYVDNTEGFLVINLSSIVNTQKLKLTALRTIIPDQEKRIYMLEITKNIGELNISSLEIGQSRVTNSYKNIYGGNIQVVNYPSQGKVKLSIGLDNLKGADYSVYKTLKRHSLQDSYSVYVYYSDEYTLLDSEAYFLVNDNSQFLSNPESDTLQAGIKGKLSLEEC